MAQETQAFSPTSFHDGLKGVNLARFNMLAQQIRPWEVSDESVLQAMADIPREAFVPAAWRSLAFSDFPIPLDHGETMLKPNLEGRLLQALQPRPDDHALLIGTGSGYLTACLATLTDSVDSIDIHQSLTQTAQQHINNLGIKNVRLITADAASGWGNTDQYDVILITGAVPALTNDLTKALRKGGRMVAFVGQEPNMHAVLVMRNQDGQLQQTELFETVVPALHSKPVPKPFSF